MIGSTEKTFYELRRIFGSLRRISVTVWPY